jgi:hypothetical protein
MLAALPCATAFAVKSSHTLGVVAVACDGMHGDHPLDLCKIIRREADVLGSQCLRQLLAPPGPEERNDV